MQDSTISTDTPKAYWFVSAAFHHSPDQTERFIESGIWESHFDDRRIGSVKAIQAGDRIAIKAAYTRKHGLPFEIHGEVVSVIGNRYQIQYDHHTRLAP